MEADHRSQVQYLFPFCAKSLNTAFAEFVPFGILSNATLDEKFILFGTSYGGKGGRIFEYIVLKVKYFLYQCETNKVIPHIVVFKQRLKKNYEIAKLNCTY